MFLVQDWLEESKVVMLFCSAPRRQNLPYQFLSLRGCCDFYFRIWQLCSSQLKQWLAILMNMCRFFLELLLGMQENAFELGRLAELSRILKIKRRKGGTSSFISLLEIALTVQNTAFWLRNNMFITTSSMNVFLLPLLCSPPQAPLCSWPFVLLG